MQILGMDEDVRVQEIAGHLTTPISRPRWLNVSVLDTPSILKASR